jgi:hypothetical protein
MRDGIAEHGLAPAGAARRMNILTVLINPQREELELGERAIVCSAANVLQIGEFQVLQLAYRSWFGRDLPETLIDRLFTSYMLRNEVPHWARHFARDILKRDAAGALDPDHPTWHRFDHTYHHEAPKGMRTFVTATGLVALTLASAILAASVATTAPTSVLPPFFERSHLPDDTGPAAPAAGVQR